MNNQTITVGKTPKKTILILVVAAILLIVGSNAFFFLEEGESAILQRFGNIEAVFMRDVLPEVKEEIEGRGVSLRIGTGLKLKIPFIDEVTKYTSKLILYDSTSNEVLTRDRHRLLFDNTAHWRIDNPLLFYQNHRTISAAKNIIEGILFAEMRVRVGQIESYELISNREVSGQLLQDMVGVVNTIFADRGDGLSIVDIRIKRTDLPVETYNSIHNRMITERQRIAAEHRAEGERELTEIKAATDREVDVITTDADRRAEEIRGEADSEAARIYNEAYNRDPAFFEFYNLLETYRKTIGSGSTMVVPLDSPFAKYLLGVTQPPAAAPAAAAPPPSQEE
jgi:membrane protease subunit HflC